MKINLTTKNTKITQRTQFQEITCVLCENLRVLCGKKQLSKTL